MVELRLRSNVVWTKAAETQFASEPSTTPQKRSASTETRKSLPKESAAMFGSVNNLAVMELRWQRDRLVWISKQKIVELGRDPSDKMLHRSVLVKNTHSALTTWKGDEKEKKSAFAFCF